MLRQFEELENGKRTGKLLEKEAAFSEKVELKLMTVVASNGAPLDAFIHVAGLLQNFNSKALDELAEVFTEVSKSKVVAEKKAELDLRNKKFSEELR